ncbi:MAG TPA: histidine kinase N-terminal 7TM domain-containing protein [Clostridia bacterium]|nr:histidine kinase N-terminal 7TM domain-containing protein [Clostridia bacterium]
MKILIYAAVSVFAILMIYHIMLKGKKSPIAFSFVTFQVFILLWAFHDIILEISSIISPALEPSRAVLIDIYHYSEFFLTCFTPYVWLVFSFVYTRSGSYADHLTAKGHIKDKWFLIALFLPCLFFYYLHSIRYFKDLNLTVMEPRRLLYLVYIVVCYSYMIAGIILIVHYAWKAAGYARKQAIMVSFAALLPFLTSLVQNYRIQVLRTKYEMFGVDLTLLTFLLTLLVLYIAFSRYRFLNPMPYAMRELFNVLEFPIIVFDNGNQVLECNKSFERSFFNFGSDRKKDAYSLSDFLKEKAAVNEDLQNVVCAIENQSRFYNGELEFEDPLNRNYSISIRPIFINNNEFIGRLVLFYDITELRRAINALNESICDLKSANDRLRDYSVMVGELTVERERNRIAHDIHDTFGRSMTILNTVLKSCIISCDKDVAATREKLASAVAITKEGLNEVRRTVSGIMPDQKNPGGIHGLLKGLAYSYAVAGLDVDLSVEELDDILSNEQLLSIHRICQEALTNAVRHGNAKHADIVIQAYNENIRIFISDDGYGSTQFKTGFGLEGMEQRVRELNGRIRFGNNGDHGFHIYVEMPVLKKISPEVTGFD